MIFLRGIFRSRKFFRACSERSVPHDRGKGGSAGYVSLIRCIHAPSIEKRLDSGKIQQIIVARLGLFVQFDTLGVRIERSPPLGTRRDEERIHAAAVGRRNDLFEVVRGLAVPGF